MIKKQNLWFLTLFSLVLVLGVYYVTMPSDVIVNKEENDEVQATIEVLENEYLMVLKQEKEEERTTLKKEYEQILNSSTTTSEEKNNAYLKIKNLTELTSEEDLIQYNIKKEFELDSFVKINEDNIQVVIIKDSHDTSLANNIMRFIQENYDTKKTISVEFKS
ncbi:MAG: SpoIIIAH-like family protein [bacterium]|nr:SpoIIIAH-like family protein [bacterium]